MSGIDLLDEPIENECRHDEVQPLVDMQDRTIAVGCVLCGWILVGGEWLPE